MDPSSLLQVFNIKWVVRRAGLRGTAGVRKVPFLAVLVHSLDNTHADATAVLKDPTGKWGTMLGSFEPEPIPFFFLYVLALLIFFCVCCPSIVSCTVENFCFG